MIQGLEIWPRNNISHFFIKNLFFSPFHFLSPHFFPLKGIKYHVKNIYLKKAFYFDRTFLELT